MSNKEKIMGIDLGNTSCCVGVLNGIQVEIVSDNMGNSTIPFLIGKKIENNETIQYYLSSDLKNTAIYPRKIIGRSFKNLEVQKEIKYWPVKIIEDTLTGKPQYCINIEGKEKKYFPDDVYKLIIQKLKNQTEGYFLTKIKKAIIAIPTYFDNEQIECLKKVFEDIGINIIKIIYEPTAIAIAYRYNNDLNESNVLIFNFTKEICEITVMNIVENNYTILSSCYDLHLGGDDLTDALTSFLLNEFKKKFGFENEDFYDKNNIKLYNSLIRLRKQCEEIKIQLSHMIECDCNIIIK